MASVETMISFLVSRKFGSTAILAPAIASFEKTQNSENSKKVAQIEDYKRTLRNPQSNELLSLYNEELVRQEKESFYNQCYANADFMHWAKAAHWTLDEAIALSFGKEPEIVTWKEIEKLKGQTNFAKTFAKRRDLAVRAKFSDEITPIEFIKWSKKLDIELHVDLVSKVEKISGAAINWHEQYLELKNEYDALVAKSTNLQKPESTRKSENLLQTLTALAMVKYNYIPIAEKSTVPQELSDLLAKKGVLITPQTIRGWLKEGTSLLRANSNKA